MCCPFMAGSGHSGRGLGPAQRNVSTMSRRLLLALSCTVVMALAAPVAAPATAAPPRPAAPPVEPVTIEPLRDPDAFRNPPRAVRPKIRWWWSGDYDPKKLVSELEAI